MALDIRKLAHRQNFRLETESLGTIQCGSLTVGMRSKIEKEVKADDIDSVTFTRNLLRKVGRHVKEIERKEKNQDTDETESVSIADVDIDSLSDEEVQDFARKFVAHNDWLPKTYKNAQRSVTTNEKGENAVSIQPTQVILPKENTERDSDYLVRVLRRYLDEQGERMKRMLRPLSGSLFRNIFSNATEGLVKKHVSLSNELGKTLRGLRPGLTGAQMGSIVERGYSNIEIPPLPENPVNETNRRLGDVLEHADELRPIILQSAELFRNMSDTALQMHGDFNRSARQSLFVSLVVVCIATASLVVTALYSWWSYEQSLVQETQYLRKLSDQQAQIETLIEQQHDRYQLLLGNQNKQLKAIIERQDAQVEQLIESLQAGSINQSGER